MKLRTLAACAAIALAASACASGAAGTSSSSASPGGIAHAQGAADLVLQIRTEGGFVAPSTTFVRIPAFSLYGDGSVITGGAQDMIYPGAALPPILTQTVTEEGLQAVLRAAIAAGLEDGEDHTSMGSTMIADATTTVFTFRADGVNHTVRVYALSELSDQPDGMPADEYAARRDLAELERRLLTLSTWLPAGAVGETTPYEAAGSRLFVSEYRPDPELTEPALEWPLDGSLATFGASTGLDGTACGVISGSDWAQRLRPLADRANQLTPWTSGDARFAIAFRPLLPDETAC
jgi:hypothetical protein